MRERLAAFTGATGHAAAQLPTTLRELREPPPTGESRVSVIGRHVSRHAKEAAAVAIQLPIAALYAALALAHVVLAMLLKVIARLPSLTRQLRHAEWLPVTEWLPAMRQSLPSSAADALRGAAGSPLQLSTPVRAVRDGARVAADAAGTHTALLMRAVGVQQPMTNCGALTQGATPKVAITSRVRSPGCRPTSVTAC